MNCEFEAADCLENELSTFRPHRTGLHSQLSGLILCCRSVGSGGVRGIMPESLLSTRHKQGNNPNLNVVRFNALQRISFRFVAAAGVE